MKTLTDIRSEFLGFFKGKGHEIVPSSPLVPQNDPTLMFVNSGMVQFKDVFTGKEKRAYSRATTAQKCVRAGGKHNDLDNVGYTARHHTFFEMMGNFSFGDYFKEEAISYAWEMVSKNLAMPKDKLLVTVYHEDEAAANLWKKIAGFSDERIIRISTNDNFWMMGDTGPCGPCSEIFYDQGDTLAGGPPGSPDEDGDRFLEFWNLVFMQFEQEPDGNGGYNRKPLPRPSIDTGMGLERATALMQGKFTNYDIDLLRGIIEHVAALTGVSPDGPQAASHRVIADHLRASAFLMADGVMPSNEGRGYVLRRIMRRGMRHAHLLGAHEPLMHRLFPTLLASMGGAYPELKRAEGLIVQSLKSEEERFKITLERGLKMLDEETANIPAGGAFSGAVAFKLYDTYGFPLDLTQDALKVKNVEVDVAEFEICMAEQKKKARAAWAGSGDAGTEKLWFEILDDVGATEFLGYDYEQADGQIKAIIKDGKRVESLRAGENGIIITNQTPFYAESGGQAGDTGEIYKGTTNPSTAEAVMAVTDTRKQLGTLFLHHVEVRKGEVKAKDSVIMMVDHTRRAAIRANHSATHLLHKALQMVLGDHVTQKGSLQDSERTRFDISHPQALTADDINDIEDLVNRQIRANLPVETRLMSLDEARATGAMALFGEKYDEEVRVVAMGDFSVELCGGTHVKRTGDIGLFKITSESALSSGIRRIEALTAQNALSYYEAQEARVQDIAALLKSSPAEAVERVRALAEDRKKLEKEVADLRRKLATGGGGAPDSSDVKNINGIKFMGRVLEGFPAKDLKPMVDDFKQKIGSGVIVLVATDEGKASIVVGVTADLTGKISAVDLVKTGATALGGQGGGGRPDMAQAGGPNAACAQAAIDAIAGKLKP